MADKGQEPSKAFAWQESKPGLIIIILFNLFGAYIFGTMAFRSGSVVGYLFTAVFLFLAIAQGFMLYKKVSKG